jgi:adenylate cyclase
MSALAVLGACSCVAIASWIGAAKRLGVSWRRPVRLSRWRVRLRPSIVMTFLFVMLPLFVVMIAVLYRQNSQLAINFAADAMKRASNDAVIGIRSLLDPIARTVSLSAALGGDQQELLRRPEFRRTLLDDLEQLPNLYSLYYGFASNGSFLQAVRLPSGIDKFGPYGAPPPAGARFVIRIIDDADGGDGGQLHLLRRLG